MRTTFYFLFAACLLTGCSQSEKDQKTMTDQSASPDSATAAVPKAQNCQSVVETGMLGKSDVYQESAKSIAVTLTVDQDTSTTQTRADCFFNNVVTVLAAKKSGSQIFRRVLSKDDLLYFITSDDAVQRAVLRQVTYKPTFNSRKYVTITMRLVEPNTQKATDYTVFMNYFGEIIKVK